MSGEQPIVQHLNPNHEDSDEEEFLAEADALEIVEVDELQIEGADDEMDEDEAEDDSHEMDESNEPVEGGEQDGAEMLLENGFDDSVATYEGHQSALFSVALHPISPLVAISGGADDMGHIWRTDTGEVLKVLDGHTDSVTSVAFNFDGEMVATGGMDGLVRIWQRVKGSVDYKEWEFLIQLEGPDEVNVRPSIYISSSRHTNENVAA
jgi:ribosome assembly protein SQT1